ncbi:MAG: hypothetical protein KDB27_00205, partial [Planctomycetales bacterium]|nr:hypothetical protein [Planctomycetales bacterium]
SGIVENEIRVLSVNDGVTFEEFPVDGGVVEVECDHPIIARLYWTDDSGQTIELHTINTSLRMVRLDGQTVAYRIFHANRMATPFRVDFRTVSEDIETPVTAHWSFVNANGETIRDGNITLSPTVSVFDSATMRSVSYQVSDPLRYYWVIPEEVCEFRIDADREILVAAFTRPADITRVFAATTLAESTANAVTETQDSDRSWFVIRPNQYEELQTNHHTCVVTYQPRPPEKNELVQTGDYSWISYQPHGLWRARRILSPRDPTFPVRDQSRAMVYVRLEPNHEYEVEFDDQGQPPTIIYDQQDVGSEISVVVDGRVVAVHRCRSHRGEFALDEIPDDGRMLELRSSVATPLYMNFVSTTDGSLYQRRIAYRMDNGKLEFEYEKHSTDEEIVSVRVFRSDSLNQSTQLEIAIPELDLQDVGPRTQWTWNAKRYECRLADDSESLLLDGSAQNANSGDLAFVRFGEDVPPGIYRIQISRLDKGDGYAVLYRTVPQIETRNVRIMHRRELEDVQ